MLEVRFVKLEAAVRALEGLHGKLVEADDARLVVTMTDPTVLF